MTDYILNCMLGGWAVVMVVAGYPTHNGYESVGQQASVVQQCESTAQKIKKRFGAMDNVYITIASSQQRQRPR